MTRRLQVVTNSELGTFRNCSQLHGFIYPDLLRPKLEAPYFAEGHAYHAGAEAAILRAFDPDVVADPLEHRQAEAITAGRNAAAESWRAYHKRLREVEISDEHRAGLLERAGEMTTVIGAMVERYVRGVPSDFERLIPLATEYRFEIPIPDASGGLRSRVRLRGVIDAIWWDPDQADLVIDDHKTTASGADTITRNLGADPQLCGYLVAVRHLLRRRLGELINVGTLRARGISESALADLLQRAAGGGVAIRTGRIRYNVLRKKIPTEPKVLKSGLVSSAKTIDTTAEVYGAALVGQGLHGTPATEAQLALLETLREKPDRWFSQIETWRTPEEIERWRVEAVVDARRIRALERDPGTRTRNLWYCTGPGGSCAHRPICDVARDAATAPPEILDLFRIADSKHEEWGPDGA